MQRWHGGAGNPLRPTDVGRFRHRAVEYSYDLLSERLKRLQDTATRHRIHVVQFGDAAVAHPPVSLSYDPTRPAAAGGRRALSGILPVQDLGMTNPASRRAMSVAVSP